jgi:hypothetical protein
MENDLGVEIGPLFGMREINTDLCYRYNDPKIAVACSGFKYCLLNGNCLDMNQYEKYRIGK